MDATTYTGTGATNNVLNQYGFKPDLVWIKSRSNAFIHTLEDTVRGVSRYLDSASTAAEVNDPPNFITAFNPNGFTQAGNSAVGANGSTYVAWQWQAGQGSTSSNTQGSITSTVSVNQTAGFSIVTYTGTGSVATIGHGLGVAPAMIIIKARSATQSWLVYHQSIGNTGFVYLNETTAANFSINGWNNTSPTSTVFTTGVNGLSNQNGQTQVAYCWAQVAGFSAFGSYTGNGSYGGPFVYTGFRPKFVMLKMTSSTNPWQMYDSSRDPYNYSYHILAANSSSAEDSSSGAGVAIDLLSNGFKIRTDWADINTNGGSYIYMAWAENPFKFSNAR